jgi:hypothetical protein
MKSGRQDMMYQQRVSQVDGRLSRRLIQFNGLACDVADQSHPLLLLRSLSSIGALSGMRTVVSSRLCVVQRLCVPSADILSVYMYSSCLAVDRRYINLEPIRVLAQHLTSPNLIVNTTELIEVASHLQPTQPLSLHVLPRPTILTLNHSTTSQLLTNPSSNLLRTTPSLIPDRSIPTRGRSNHRILTPRRQTHTLRPSRQQPRALKDNLRINRKPALLHNIPRNTRRINVFLQILLLPIIALLRIAHSPPLALILPRLQNIRVRLDSPLLHNVRHQIQPLPIPAQNPRVNFEAREGRDFALEEAADGAESDVVFAFDGADFGGEALFVAGVEALEAGSDYVAHQVGARDVQVQKVRRVRFMAVVVTVAWGVPGRGDHGREEVFRGALLFLEENLVDEALEDSPLLL